MCRHYTHKLSQNTLPDLPAPQRSKMGNIFPERNTEQEKGIYVYFLLFKVTFATPFWVPATGSKHLFLFSSLLSHPCKFFPAFSKQLFISYRIFPWATLLLLKIFWFVPQVLSSTFSGNPCHLSFLLSRTVLQSFGFSFHVSSTIANISFQTITSFEGCTLLLLH